MDTNVVRVLAGVLCVILMVLLVQHRRSRVK